MTEGSMSIDAAAKRDQLPYVDRQEKRALGYRTHHNKITPWRKARQQRQKDKS